MAKFYGKVGFESNDENAPGVWEGFYEKAYRGDLTKVMNRNQEQSNVNEDIALSNILSIPADSYILTHFADIRYIEYMGAKWKITSVEVNPPRLTLYIGGIYNA